MGDEIEKWMIDYEHAEGQPQHAVLSWIDREAKGLPAVGTELVRLADYESLRAENERLRERIEKLADALEDPSGWIGGRVPSMLELPARQLRALLGDKASDEGAGDREARMSGSETREPDRCVPQPSVPPAGGSTPDRQTGEGASVPSPDTVTVELTRPGATYIYSAARLNADQFDGGDSGYESDIARLRYALGVDGDSGGSPARSDEHSCHEGCGCQTGGSPAPDFEGGDGR